MEENKIVISEVQKILEVSSFQKKLAHIAVEKGESHAKVNEEAEGYLNELYSEHNPTTNLLFMEATQYLLSRGYDKTIDVDPNEVKELTKLMRKHPVAFVLTHKSYIDLLVLALVMARHGLPLPYMFAGINLDLFGVGKIARKNGVIFIRRSARPFAGARASHPPSGRRPTTPRTVRCRPAAARTTRRGRGRAPAPGACRCTPCRRA